MSDYVLLVRAMADRCREMIAERGQPNPALPASLRPLHLQWMCTQIAAHAGDWPAIRVHRWLGFIQAGMIANQILALDEAKWMFDAAKNAFGETDQDLIDHLDASTSFELDLGGQG